MKWKEFPGGYFVFIKYLDFSGGEGEEEQMRKRGVKNKVERKRKRGRRELFLSCNVYGINTKKIKHLTVIRSRAQAANV